MRQLNDYQFLNIIAKRVFCVVLLVFLAGCTRLDSVEVPFVKAVKNFSKDSENISDPGTFVAGAATVDITPPPDSLPRAGYALWSTIGQGFRTRLYARVYYLRDAQGDSHLVVQTDLTSGSRILHTRLGAVLAKETDIDASRLTITSTHSHSAPGQIMGSQFYNKHISHVSGFASDYFEFLIEQISVAARDAIVGARPAKLSTGSLDIWGLTRNRSIQAYVENDTVSNKSLEDNRTFHSVNPTMHMVRIDEISSDGSTHPMAAFATFSIHGTALPEKETLYNADVWAYIHKDWETAILNKNPELSSVHVSAFEGTHGDVAPASRFGLLGYIEARRVGQAIAQKTINLYDRLEKSLTAEVDIQSAIRYVNLREDNKIEGISLCDEAAAGMTLAAAPLEHTSPVIGYLPFFKQGSRRWGDEEENCQGRKRILGFSWLQPLFEPKDSFPDYMLLQLVRINDMVMAPYPFELTVESGERLANDIQESFASTERPVDHIMITSLAGGYTGYVTTPEEYGRQYYEGGHTIYGKYTLPYLRAHTRQLAREMSATTKTINELPESWHYQFEMTNFLPEKRVPARPRKSIERPSFHHAHTNKEGHWRFVWQDAAPGNMQFHQPLLSVETRAIGAKEWRSMIDDQGRAVNDEGYDMAVRVDSVDDDAGMAQYIGYWFNPLFRGESFEYRFVVQPRAGFDVFYSEPFH